MLARIFGRGTSDFDACWSSHCQSAPAGADTERVSPCITVWRRVCLQIWKRLEGHLGKIGMPDDQIRHLIEKDDPELVAEALKKYT